MRITRWIVMVGVLLAGRAAEAANSTGNPGPKALSGAKKVSGTVEAIDGQKLTVKGHGNETKQLTLGAETRFLESQPLSKDDLKEGDRIQALATLQSDGSMQVAAIAVLPKDVEGVAASMAQLGWTGGSGSAIPSGTGSGTSAAAQARMKPLPVTGTIRSVEVDRLSVQTAKGLRQLTLTPTAQFVRSRPITKDDLKQGDQVQAFVQPKGKEMHVVAIRSMAATAATSTPKDESSSAGSGSATPSSAGSGGTESSKE
jgi:hypothetical protein